MFIHPSGHPADLAQATISPLNLGSNSPTQEHPWRPTWH